MRRWPIAIFAAILILAVFLHRAEAGMPSVSLSNLARMRLEVISFFLLGFAVSSTVVWWIWNSLARDFAFLPRLTLAKSFGLVALWGLLFVVVLTMISGARELMTPGAWEPNGSTYRLRGQAAAAPDPPRSADEQRLADRRQQLQRLGTALTRHAALHEGRFPSTTADLEPADLWQIPHSRGERYCYLAGSTLSHGERPLAYEPQCFDDDPLVLFADGSIRAVTPDELRSTLRREAP